MHRNSVHVRFRYFNEFISLLFKIKPRGASGKDPLLPYLHRDAPQECQDIPLP